MDAARGRVLGRGGAAGATRHVLEGVGLRQQVVVIGEGEKLSESSGGEAYELRAGEARTGSEEQCLVDERRGI